MRLFALTTLVALLLAGCGGDDSADEAARDHAVETSGPAPGADLTGVKTYLTDHTGQLVDFTGQFRTLAQQYDKLAAASTTTTRGSGRASRGGRAAAGEGEGALGRGQPVLRAHGGHRRRHAVARAVRRHHRRRLERRGGPGERRPVRPELADGGSSSSPATSTTSPRARSGARSRRSPPSVKADLDGDGTVEFGEVLPDARVLTAAARWFDSYASELDDRRRRPGSRTPSDAFTALVVMVPTMSEYFGQWKESRFVARRRGEGESFNVVSRLSDIHDILAGLQVVYDDVEPAIAERRRGQAAQTRRGARRPRGVHRRPQAQEQAGKRFTPEQADLLGAEAQERGDGHRRPGLAGRGTARGRRSQQ